MPAYPSAPAMQDHGPHRRPLTVPAGDSRGVRPAEHAVVS